MLNNRMILSEYMYKKKPIKKNHMNIKHNHNHIDKECNSKDTSEKVKDQQEPANTIEKKDKDKNRMIS